MVNVNASTPAPEALPRVPQTPLPEVGFPGDIKPLRSQEVFPGGGPRPVQGGGPRPVPVEKAEPREDGRKPDKGRIQREIQTLNKILDGLGHRLEFGIVESTEEMFVKVVDRTSNSVVKVVPSQSLLELHAKLESAIGLFLDEIA